MSMKDTPWGAERMVLSTDVSLGGEHGTLAVRKVDIDTDEMTSVHQHHHKHELLVVESGLVEVMIGDDYVELEDGDAHFIEAGTTHQIQNIDNTVADITEIGFPFDPDDIDRIEDPYAHIR